jgi:hypothetical protein
MVNLNDAVSLLRAKRSELLDQLQAVDNAIAALGGLSVAVTTTPDGRPAEEEKASGGVVPTKLKSPRMLSDDHKHALNEGRRRARHSKAVAAGFAREMLDSSPDVTPAAADGGRPRLVKRPRK